MTTKQTDPLPLCALSSIMVDTLYSLSPILTLHCRLPLSSSLLAWRLNDQRSSERLDGVPMGRGDKWKSWRSNTYKLIQNVCCPLKLFLKQNLTKRGILRAASHAPVPDTRFSISSRLYWSAAGWLCKWAESEGPGKAWL